MKIVQTSEFTPSTALLRARSLSLEELSTLGSDVVPSPTVHVLFVETPFAAFKLDILGLTILSLCCHAWLQRLAGDEILKESRCSACGLATGVSYAVGNFWEWGDVVANLAANLSLIVDPLTAVLVASVVEEHLEQLRDSYDAFLRGRKTAGELKL